MSKSPGVPLVDQHVGGLIRLHRREAGASQDVLAEALGLTPQQIQKYEQGTNTVSASKLFQIAQTLQMPVGALFEGLDQEAQHPRTSSNIARALQDPGARSLLAAYGALPPAVRKHLVGLAGAMVDAMGAA